MAKIVFAFALLAIFAIVAARPENQSNKQRVADVELLESDKSEKDLKGSESIGYGYYGGLYPGYGSGYGYPSYGYGYSSYLGGGYPYYGYSGGFGGLYSGYYW